MEFRKIIHIDMDAFYASVEQLDNPELRGKPVAVGGNEERGVVSAASYEARQFGVRSAMSGVLAARKCPGLIFVRPRFQRYSEISQQIRSIFYDYTDLVEPLAFDEAFLDVTRNKKGIRSASILAFEIRKRIWEELGLTASAGISINKFTAKIACDVNKPNGQLTVPPADLQEFLDKLPIEKFFGVGKVTAEKFRKQGIFTGRDLRNRPLAFLTNNYGKQGQHFYDIVRGIQSSPVIPDRLRKSVAVENTFSRDLISVRQLLEALEKQCEELEKRLEKTEIKGKTVTIKIKFADFTQQTRSRTFPNAMGTYAEIFPIAESLLLQESIEEPVRLLGVSLSKLDGEDEQKEEVQLTLEF
jgi:DNA polymerase-4